MFWEYVLRWRTPMSFCELVCAECLRDVFPQEWFTGSVPLWDTHERWSPLLCDLERACPISLLESTFHLVIWKAPRLPEVMPFLWDVYHAYLGCNSLTRRLKDLSTFWKINLPVGMAHNGRFFPKLGSRPEDVVRCMFIQKHAACLAHVLWSKRLRSNYLFLVGEVI